MTAASVAVDDLVASVYVVPTGTPEVHGTLTWDSTTVVVVEARAGGREELGWSYCGAGAATVVQDKLAEVVRGADATAPPQAPETMVRAVRNMGRLIQQRSRRFRTA